MEQFLPLGLLNSLAPGKFVWNFRHVIFKQILVIDSWGISVKLPWYECHCTSLMISQYWFRLWLGVVRQQAITWANVDPDLCHHMASLGHNELQNGHWRIHSKCVKYLLGFVEDGHQTCLNHCPLVVQIIQNVFFNHSDTNGTQTNRGM